MMRSSKEWLLWVVLGLLVVASIAVYPHLPDQVPSHWNINGEVDAYASREFGAFFGPGLAIGIYILLLATPRIDPKGANFTKYGKAYDVFRWMLVLFFVVLSVVTWLVALGYAVNIGTVIGSLIALLFVVLGNYLPKIQYSNYTFGIRTPWTLDSEEVWRETHRWAGKMTVIGGTAGLVGVLINQQIGFYVLMAGLLVPSFGAVVYSYLCYRRIKAK